jgi:hypothetical protein
LQNVKLLWVYFTFITGYLRGLKEGRIVERVLNEIYAHGPYVGLAQFPFSPIGKTLPAKQVKKG